MLSDGIAPDKMLENIRLVGDTIVEDDKELEDNTPDPMKGVVKLAENVTEPS